MHVFETFLLGWSWARQQAGPCSFLYNQNKRYTFGKMWAAR